MLRLTIRKEIPDISRRNHLGSVPHPPLLFSRSNTNLTKYFPFFRKICPCGAENGQRITGGRSVFWQRLKQNE
jgi:hypothetical protein